TAFLSGYLFQPLSVKAIDGLTSAYQTNFSSGQMDNKKPIVAIADPSSTEKELMEQVNALKQTKNQEVTLLTYSGYTIQNEESNTENKLEHKVETTSEGIRMTNFYYNVNAVSNSMLSEKWDVSKNNFDLVSGLLTIELTIEEGLTVDDILIQSKGWIELLMIHNAEKEIQAIDLEIKSGKENYFFESVKADTLESTKMIYTN
ncbi:MAG: hypothetical protein N2A99_03240, partial [Carnobacterium alterfunditum]